MNNLYALIAQANEWHKACNSDWIDRAEDRLDEYLAHLPYGSGFDSGVQFDAAKSSDDRLYFSLSFHRMDENGYYAGWYDYKVVVKASLSFGMALKITGKDIDGLKDYVAETLHTALTMEYAYAP